MRISDWSSDVCSSDLITRDGIFLEQLETNPAQYLPDHEDKLSAEVVKVDLNQPMSEIRKLLSRHPVKTRLSLSGTLIVARDIAPGNFAERIEKGQGLPDYVQNHMTYSPGTAKTDRTRVVWCKRVEVRGDLGGSRIRKKKKDK